MEHAISYAIFGFAIVGIASTSVILGELIDRVRSLGRIHRRAEQILERLKNDKKDSTG